MRQGGGTSRILARIWSLVGHWSSFYFDFSVKSISKLRKIEIKNRLSHSKGLGIWVPVDISRFCVKSTSKIVISISKRSCGKGGAQVGLWPEFCVKGGTLALIFCFCCSLNVLVLKYRSAVAQALVQWQFRLELSTGYLCGHWYSFGTALLLDDTRLCVSWRLCLCTRYWECLGEACSSVKLLVPLVWQCLRLKHSCLKTWTNALLLLSRAALWSHGAARVLVASDKPGWSCQ